MPVTQRATAPGERPVLIYDGDCGFCTTSVRLLVRWLRPPVDVVAWQHTDLAGYGLTEAAARRAVQWVGPDGHSAGAPAVAALLRRTGGPWWVLGTLLGWPLIRQVAAVAYRLIAANRHRLPGGTPACALPPPADHSNRDGSPAPRRTITGSLSE
jgi:predicted DCC family thiol-disulfide oxidoreductase YuxK